MQILQTLKLPRSPSITPSCLCPSQLTQTKPKEKTQGMQWKSFSHLLYLSERCVNKHRDLCHGHRQGLDDGHSLCPSKCHLCTRISAPPGVTKGKGTCGCCVSCSQRNPTFLWHLAESPGVSLHPTILLLQKEVKKSSEWREHMTCTSSYRTSQTTHQVIEAAMPLEPRRSKASSTAVIFFACPTNHRGRFPNCSTAAASLDSTAARDFYIY